MLVSEAGEMCGSCFWGGGGGGGGREMRTEDIRDDVCGELIDYSFVLQRILIKPQAIQESICEKAADISQNREHNDRPPESPIKRQALRQAIVECQERALDGPGACEEQVGGRPLRPRKRFLD